MFKKSHNRKMNVVKPQVVKRLWNTKARGLVEFLIFKEGTQYVGVCLTFNIVVEDKDVEKVEKSVEDAAKLHLRVVQKKKLPDELLNRHAPKEYWDRYEAFCKYLYAKEINARVNKNIVYTSQEPYKMETKAAAPAS